MPKVTVQHEGKDIEVELDGYVSEAALAAEYIPKAKHDRVVHEERAKAKRSTLTSALNDEAFKTQALAAWGIDLTKNASGEKLSDQQLAAAKADWEAKALRPLQEQLTAKDAGLTKLQQKVLQKSIVAAAREFKVKPEFVETMKGSSKPMIVSMLEGVFGLHDDDGEFYVKKPDGSGFEVSGGTGGSVYAGIEDYFAGLAKDKDSARFFDRPTQTVGSGNARSAASDTPGVVANDPMSIGMNLADIASGKAVVQGTGA